MAVLFLATGGAANAYTLAEAAQPAEVPPSSYSADVYVDSRGCAYVRATIGAVVNWVPRLTNDRETVVCGLTPTNAVAAAPVPAPLAPPTPVESTMPAATPAAPDRPATPVRLAASRLAPAPVEAPEPAAPVEVTNVMSVTCPADGSTARIRIGEATLAITCFPGQTIAKSYIVRHSNGERTRLVVNPPEAAPATTLARVRMGGVAPGGATNGFGNGYGVGGYAPVTDPVPAPTPIATTAMATAPVAIPEGYRAAWDDDRLNPDRGPKTELGNRQMAEVWDTSKMPMRAVAPAAAQAVYAAPVPAPAPAPVAASARGYRYVQVGMFNVPSNADRAVARLIALGLPGRIATTRSGKRVVVAGPYDSAAALKDALALVRRNGFSDAFLRI